jgi:hypothetical protein
MASEGAHYASAAHVPDEVWAVFRDFWADIVTPGGQWDLGQVMRELFDYKALLDEVPKVYSEITNGLIGKPNTAADAVLAAHEDTCHRYCDEEAHATELDRMAAECERLERERDIANAQAARLAERLAALTT